MEKSKLIAPKKAFLWLFFSTLLISGTAALALLYYRHVKELYANDDAYEIVAIIQSTPEKEALKTMYLTELLDLSVDQPINIYRFSSSQARKKLLACPLIKDAHVRKMRPGIIFVDYIVRKPMAFLIDYENTAIDLDWVSIPFKPFFSPKRLPEVYLGIAQNEESVPVSGGEWGTQLSGKKIELAKALFKHIQDNYLDEKTHLARIDVSDAYSPSCGQRQIVVIVEHENPYLEGAKPIIVKYEAILRLNTENHIQGLANYFALASTLLKSEPPTDAEGPVVKFPTMILDLRLSQLAFVKRESNE